MKKHITLFFAILMINITLNSGIVLSKECACKQKAKDIEILKSKVKQTEILKGDFTQTKKITGIKKEFITTGAFIFSKKYGVIWHTKNPFDIKYIITENSIKEIQNNETKVIAKDAQNFFKEFSKVFNAILTADYDKLKNDFKLDISNKKNEIIELILIPENNTIKEIYEKITLKITTHINEIKFYETSKDTTVIEFKNLQHDIKKLEENEIELFK